VVTAPAGSPAIDPRVQALAAAVQEAIQKGGIDPPMSISPVAFRSSHGLLYISRVPDCGRPESPWADRRKPRSTLTASSLPISRMFRCCGQRRG